MAAPKVLPSNTDRPAALRGHSLTAIIGVALVVFVSKILGVAREMVVADRFGTTADYDLYLIAVMLPALAYGIINFASFYLLVPHLTRTLSSERDGEEAEWRSAWSVFNLALLSALGIAVAIVLLAPYLMRVWTSGYSEAAYTRIVLYSRLTAFIVVLGTSEAFLRALLNVKRVFTYPAGGYIIENGIFIVSVVVLHRMLGVGAIVVGLLGGMLLQSLYLATRLIPLGGLRHYRPDLGREQVGILMPTAAMLILIELLNRSYFLFDRYVASSFGAGIISALNYSQVLVQLPDAVVGFAIASVVFPMFSQIKTDGEKERFGNVYRNAILGGMLLTVPLAVFFCLNAADLVRVIYFRGVFDLESLELTASALRPYTPTIVALFVISTSLRAAYGRGWTRYVLMFSAGALALKAAGTLTLPRLMGYPAITLVTSLSQIAFAGSLLALCLVRGELVDRGQMIRSIGLLLLAGLLAAGAGYLAGQGVTLRFANMSLAHALMRLGISGLVVATAFLLLAWLFGFGDYIGMLWRRKGHVR